MLTVIKHLPLHQLPVNEMSPDEVSNWLDERDREQRRRHFRLVVKLAVAAIAATLIYVTIGFFTH